jgi:putative membrane protein
MTKFILRWVINAVGLYLAIFLLSGRGVDFRGNWVSIIWLALIFGLVNAFLGPLLKFLTCPLIILTLGLFTILINTFLFWLTGWIGQSFDLGLTINGFWPALLGGLIMSVVSVVLSMFVKDEMVRRHR